MKPEEMQKKWAEIVAKAWADESFKKRVMQNPKEIFQEYGIEIPPGMEIEIMQNKKNYHYLIMPEKPEGKLSEEELKKHVGSGDGYCLHTQLCFNK